jgi:hypothetical protein
MLHCGHCGSLDWTVKKHGKKTHKHACPHREDAFCQSHPDGCPPEIAKDVLDLISSDDFR